MTWQAASCWYRACESSLLACSRFCFSVCTSSIKVSHSFCISLSMPGIDEALKGFGAIFLATLRSIRSVDAILVPVIGHWPEFSICF